MRVDFSDDLDGSSKLQSGKILQILFMFVNYNKSDSLDWTH